MRAGQLHVFRRKDCDVDTAVCTNSTSICKQLNSSFAYNSLRNTNRQKLPTRRKRGFSRTRQTVRNIYCFEV